MDNLSAMDGFSNLIYLFTESKLRTSYEYKIGHRIGNDWMTNSLIKLIKEDDKIYSKLNRNKSCDDTDTNRLKQDFNMLKNKLTKQIQKQKTLFFDERWVAGGINSKKQWKIINYILNVN